MNKSSPLSTQPSLHLTDIRHSNLMELSSIQTLASSQFDQQLQQDYLPQLVALSQQPRWVVLINPPAEMKLKQVLAEANIRMDRVLFVHPKDDVETLWAMEKALTNGTASAVLTWTPALDAKDQRRLQLISKSVCANGWLITQGNAVGEPRLH